MGKNLCCRQILKPDEFLCFLTSFGDHKCTLHATQKTLSTYVYIFEYYQFAANLIMGIC